MYIYMYMYLLKLKDFSFFTKHNESLEHVYIAHFDLKIMNKS